MKQSHHSSLRFGLGCAIWGLILVPVRAEPQLSSWLTEYSGQYARIYDTDASRLAGTTRTTWTGQTLPAYSGVHYIAYSPNWIYLKTTGLGAHVMGPWYLNAARTQLFPTMPKNTATTFRIPRTPQITGTRTRTGLGAIGFFVDGVAMYDNRDSYSVATYTNGTTITESPNGQGIWNRDAYVNEGLTFDPANAHQPNFGQYHYHVNPLATRYLLGDNVLFNGTTKFYAENIANTTPGHSPLIGWAADGLPVYGPYGYSNPLDASSPVRRMISGYVPRNGQLGTTNLAVTGRTTLPTWAQRVQNRTTLASSQYGPNVTATYVLGRYLEDNDYLGDLGKQLGVDFDLNEYNCRYCVTPEFPEGTYAYFLTLNSSGTPAYPYIVGRQYYGVPSGGTVTSITEDVTVTFRGGPHLSETMSQPAIDAGSGDVTLTWSSVEGGGYTLETSTDLVAWSGTAVPAARGTVTTLKDPAAAKAVPRKFYRVERTSLATYDSTGF